MCVCICVSVCVCVTCVNSCLSCPQVPFAVLEPTDERARGRLQRLDQLGVSVSPPPMRAVWRRKVGVHVHTYVSIDAHSFVSLCVCASVCLCVRMGVCAGTHTC